MLEQVGALQRGVGDAELGHGLGILRAHVELGHQSRRQRRAAQLGDALDLAGVGYRHDAGDDRGVDSNPGSAIGAACFPETHIHATSAEDDLRYLKEKVDAGARFLITQLFFDNRFYYDYVARAREAGIDVPIIPGIMPITNAGQIQRMTSLCGSCIPGRLQEELEKRAEDPRAATDFGVAYATLQCADLLANGAPGIHFYTLNRSPATRAILSALRTLSPWEAQPGFSMSSA